MIDANAYCGSVATWPEPLAYVVINATDEDKPVRFIDSKAVRDKLWVVDGVDIRHRSTAKMGSFLVRLNTHMYNESKTGFTKDWEEQTRIQAEIKKLLNGRKQEDLKDKDELHQLKDLEEKEKEVNARLDIDYEDIPSLIIASTMDMEFAHIGGYDGEFIYQEDKETGKIFYKQYGQFPAYLDDDDVLMFQNWKLQISDIEVVAASHPSRYFPLFSYDPRRYRYSVNTPRDSIIKGCGSWKEPFARIVGHGDSADGIKKVWLGFCMNPALGFRPFDEYCEHLPRFYKECADKEIPILAHCVPGGLTAHGAEYYPDRTDERTDKSKKRHDMILNEGLSEYKDDPLCSNVYQGTERVLDDKYDSLNYFYMNYGHPRNWIPALEYFPNLRLCLTGFGGNSEWQLADWSNDDALPTRQWIRCIIKLTAKYDNVYADISGLNIYDEKIKSGLRKMLELIQDDKNGELGHLKHKLIFGSGWYLTYLTNVADGGTDINGWINVRHSYSNYCSEFKSLFYAADKGGTGELWEHVSLINPETFYALSEEKIKKIRDGLSNIGKNNSSEELQTPDEREDTPNQTPTQSEDGNYKPEPKKITDAAVATIEYVKKVKGETDSACNIGVEYAFRTLTGSSELKKNPTDVLPILANDMCGYFARTNYFKEVTIEQAHKDVNNEGHIVFATLKNIGGHGHVSMVVPGELERGRWYGKGYDDKNENDPPPTLTKVPVTMDTGIKKRKEKIEINRCFDKKDHKDVVFYKYAKIKQ